MLVQALFKIEQEGLVLLHGERANVPDVVGQRWIARGWAKLVSAQEKKPPQEIDFAVSRRGGRRKEKPEGD